MYNVRFFLFGLFFGLILVKSEVVSWFRIQEMFRFQSFYMYGIIGSAVLTGAVSVYLIKTLGIKTTNGQEPDISSKKFSKGTLAGGTLFGLGWALTGACPGPLYALAGMGYSVILVALLSAIAGTYVYGIIRHKLPH